MDGDGEYGWVVKVVVTMAVVLTMAMVLTMVVVGDGADCCLKLAMCFYVVF
jgi:hypothetical protein